ncbi:MAG: nitroreductase family deazaflavin-dependent oxidoreductase [bacterium]|nr:nitroreductase family deazaflavin-dependent oxidoreductase [bacterium]
MLRKVVFALPFLLIASVAGCSGPLVLLPGGAIEGPTATIPDDWSVTDEIDTVQLETLPADPYSVNIWVVGLAESLYVHAGTNRSTWVENMEADPNVRLRANESIYELVASRVEAQEEFDRFSDAYKQKYGLRPRNENVTEAYLFRLKAR